MTEAYFDLQLQFAASYASAAGVPLREAVGRCTNLRRRFGLEGLSGAAPWERFLRGLGDTSTDRSSALAMCRALFESRAKPVRPRTFGCFSYDPPDRCGTLRIHFMPADGIDDSPLALASQSARRDELRSMFSHVRRTEPRATSVRGVSWLYHLDAYKRLFPPAYGASARSPVFPLHMTGSSTWGQVLTWRQDIKPAVRDAIVAKLSEIDAEAPCAVFPLQALTATARIETFYDRFL